MPITEWISHSADETIEIGRKIAHELKPPVLVLLTGDLGAGKTTLSKGIISGLGAAREEDVTSPTFTLVHIFQNQTNAQQNAEKSQRSVTVTGAHQNVAPSDAGQNASAIDLERSTQPISSGATKVYHIDLYRIERAADLESLGLEDALSEPAVLLIEWPDRFSIRTDWPKIEIALEHLDGDSRRIFISQLTAK